MLIYIYFAQYDKIRLSYSTGLIREHPTIVIIKAVELPGTFVERLENYFIINWIPLVFDTIVIFVFILAQVLARWFCYRDHRPFVLILMPILFTGGSLMKNHQSVEAVTSIAHWSGLTFSLIVIPISFFLAWRRHRAPESSC
jgi:spore germination protein